MVSISNKHVLAIMGRRKVSGLEGCCALKKRAPKEPALMGPSDNGRARKE